MNDFKDRYSTVDAILSVEVLGSLVSWIDNHLDGTDKLYTSFFSGGENPIKAQIYA